jgi:hypothetical protein
MTFGSAWVIIPVRFRSIRMFTQHPMGPGAWEGFDRQGLKGEVAGNLALRFV